jgi:hypothetical protein
MATTTITDGIWNIPEIKFQTTFDAIQLTAIVNSTALDLTNMDLKIQFRAGNPNGNIVKTITNGTGITYIDAANGIFRIDSFFVTLPVGTYYYDCVFIYSSGTVKRYFEGTFTVIYRTTEYII